MSKASKYILKNSYVFNWNISEDIRNELPTLE